MLSIEQQQLESFNNMPEQNLRTELLRCCGSKEWVSGMLARVPYPSTEELLLDATTVWFNLPVKEWKAAFSAHPQIGDAAALKSKFAHSKWEGDEQKGANSASDETLQQLAQLNREYLAKNGFIFLICATGKSADEMLRALQDRMRNDTATELQIAAGEQDKISKLRLLKLLQSIPTEIVESARTPISRL